MKAFKYYFNLNSIMQQDYTNFSVVFADDASTDGTATAIEEALVSWNGRGKAVMQRGTQRKGHMANIYDSVHQHCRKGELLVIVDGDDELIGRQVFKLLNAFYRQSKALSVYSNHIRSVRNAEFSLGTSRPYETKVRANSSYRVVQHNYSHLKTTWADLFLEIKPAILQDENGQWFENAVDNAFYFCLMEMSCGEVEYLPELAYKYSMFTGNNVFEQARKTSRAENAAKIKKKAPC
jgi:glycosyltransferase involved in cell wall biosynthesis